MSITLSDNSYQKNSKRLVKLLDDEMPKGRIDSIVQNNDNTVLSYSFIDLPDKTLIQLQKDLNKIDGDANLNVFFSRSGEVWRQRHKFNLL